MVDENLVALRLAANSNRVLRFAEIVEEEEGNNSLLLISTAVRASSVGAAAPW